MSLRAIRKRDNKVPYNNRRSSNPPLKQLANINENLFKNQLTVYKSKSLPDITTTISNQQDIGHKFTNTICVSKSETDVTKLAQQHNQYNANSINAKSEVCIVQILEHRTVHNNDQNNVDAMNRNKRNRSNNMMTKNSDKINNNNNNSIQLDDEQNESVYSSQSNANVSEYENHGFTSDTSAVRIPIIGYEIMEERARFTVYKLRVENPFTNDCWLVLRRYTDFVRLNNKLKQMFPNINLQLPRKKIFGDNFNAVFLDNRVQGLQIFVNSIMTNDEVRCSKLVREFFCLDEPPSYSESMEECRAIFEAQEETIAHLKLQLHSKNDLIISLQEKVMNEIADNNKLKNILKNVMTECASCCANLESLNISS